jgi:hypothetical protein
MKIEICGSCTVNSSKNAFFFGKYLPNFQNHKTEKKKGKKEKNQK